MTSRCQGVGDHFPQSWQPFNKNFILSGKQQYVKRVILLRIYFSGLNFPSAKPSTDSTSARSLWQCIGWGRDKGKYHTKLI